MSNSIKLIESNNDKTVPDPYGFWSARSIRLQMAFLLCFAMTIHGLIRASLGMALVCMIRKPLISNVSVEIISKHNTQLQVDWEANEVSLMHTAFYLGTFLSVFVAPHLSKKIGAKLVITVGVFFNAACSWAVPTIVWVWPHYLLTTALRFITGFTQGLFIPCASLLISKWFPDTEKSTAMAIFTTGNQIGISSAMYLTAQFCKVSFLGGWPVSFLFYGGLSLIFLFFWIPLATNSPRESKRIAIEELVHISGDGRDEKALRARTVSIVSKTPYKKMLLSPTIFAICLCSFCQWFVLVAMISYLPEFHRVVLGLTLSSNGKWSAMPFLIQMISKILFAFLADYMKWRGISVDFVTKLFNSIASFGCALCMFVVSWCSTENSSLMLLFLCAGLALTSGYVPGYNTSIVSVAPAHTAVVSAIAQCYAIVGGISAPIMIGLMTNNSTDIIRSWSYIFQILICALVISGTVFQIFGRGIILPWAIVPNIHVKSKITKQNSKYKICETEALVEVVPKINPPTPVSQMDAMIVPLSLEQFKDIK